MGHEVVGTFWQVLHWGPLIALSVIFTISTVAMKCNAMWWPPFDSPGGLVHFLFFTFWVLLTLYNYFMAMVRGPGFIPLGWKPVSFGWGGGGGVFFIVFPFMNFLHIE